MKIRMGMVIMGLFMVVQGVGVGYAEPGGATGMHAQSGIAAQSSQGTSAGQYLNVEGTLKEIQGDMYVLESSSGEKPVLIHVGGDTAFPNGQKEPGQAVQALVVARTGHALIIR